MAKRKRRIRRLKKHVSKLENQLGQGGLTGAPQGNLMAPPQPGQGMGDYAAYGRQMFPGQNQWAPPTFQPQGPVDLSPWESGGGGGGGPSYLYDRDLGGNRPPNWDQGGYGGPTGFGGMNKKQKRQFRRAYQKGGGKRGGARAAFGQGVRMSQPTPYQGQDMSQIMQNPVFANAMMQSAGQMMPGIGNIMQSNPMAANMFMQRMGMPDEDYSYFGRGYFGGGRDAGSPG